MSRDTQDERLTPLQLVLRALWYALLVFAIIACAEQADMVHRYMRL